MSARLVAALAGLVAAALLAVLVGSLRRGACPRDAELGGQARAVAEPRLDRAALDQRLRRIEDRLASLEARPVDPGRAQADDRGEQVLSLKQHVETLERRVESVERRPAVAAGAPAAPKAPEPPREPPAPRPDETRTAPDVSSISGRIVHVGEDATLMLNLGRIDQVPEGCEFWIFRGAAYVGRVRVTGVRADMSDVAPADGTRWSDYRLGDEARTWAKRAALPAQERR